MSREKGDPKSSSRASDRKSHRARRVTFAYAAFGCLWILGSDAIVNWTVPEYSQAQLFQTLKGLFYVLITALLVYWLARRGLESFERKLLEDQVIETENRLTAIMTNLSEAVLMIDPSTRTIKSCNQAAATIFGYDLDELIGKNTEVLHVDPVAYKRFAEVGEPVLERGDVFKGRHQMKRKDGSILETENTVIAVNNDLGWEHGVVSIVRDITDRMQALEALDKSEKRYRVLAENTADVIWAMDMDMRFTYVNPSIERLTGHTPEEFVGTSLTEHVEPGVLRELTGLIQDEVARGPAHPGLVVKTELLRKDRTPVQVEIHGRALFDPEGRPVGLQGTTRDITERLALEARVRQAEKLESIGTLASGVAHEVNNPIMGITGYADLIENSAAEGSKTRKFAADIKQEAQRVHGIVKNLLGFARKEEATPPEHVSLREIIDTTVPLITALMRHDEVNLQVIIPEGLPPLVCHKQQVQQIIMNLLTNARDALNSKYPGSDPNKKLLVTAESLTKDGRTFVRTMVEDHGPGIPQEVQERMYDPFYTTKPEDQGTGLGLWITYGIVKDHGGEITVESREGMYTRFLIDLPAAG